MRAEFLRHPIVQSGQPFEGILVTEIIEGTPLSIRVIDMWPLEERDSVAGVDADPLLGRAAL
jgi:hypothetical protein